MFRALSLFKTGETKAIMEPPLSVTLIDKDAHEQGPVELAISPDAIFTTAVGKRGKRTLASWHVTTSTEVVGHMLHLVNEIDAKSSL